MVFVLARARSLAHTSLWYSSVIISVVAVVDGFLQLFLLSVRRRCRRRRRRHLFFFSYDARTHAHWRRLVCVAIAMVRKHPFPLIAYPVSVADRQHTCPWRSFGSDSVGKKEKKKGRNAPIVWRNRFFPIRLRSRCTCVFVCYSKRVYPVLPTMLTYEDRRIFISYYCGIFAEYMSR